MAPTLAPIIPASLNEEHDSSDSDSGSDGSEWDEHDSEGHTRGVGSAFKCSAVYSRPDKTHVAVYACTRNGRPSGDVRSSQTSTSLPPARLPPPPPASLPPVEEARQGAANPSACEPACLHASPSPREDCEATARELLHQQAARRSGKAVRRGPLGIGCQFQLIIEVADEATRALIIVTRGHTHDLGDKDSCLHLPLPATVMYAGGGGLTGKSTKRGGMKLSQLQDHFRILRDTAHARSLNLLMGRSAHAPSILGGARSMAASPPRDMGSRPRYLQSAQEDANTGYLRSLHSSAAAGAAELAVCSLCPVPLAYATAIICQCSRSSGAGAHADCLAARAATFEMATGNIFSCAYCDAMCVVTQQFPPLAKGDASAGACYAYTHSQNGVLGFSVANAGENSLISCASRLLAHEHERLRTHCLAPLTHCLALLVRTLPAHLAPHLLPLCRCCCGSYVRGFTA